MTSLMEGRRGQGRPRISWINDVLNRTCGFMNEACNRRHWEGRVHSCNQQQSWSNDWDVTIITIHNPINTTSCLAIGLSAVKGASHSIITTWLHWITEYRLPFRPCIPSSQLPNILYSTNANNFSLFFSIKPFVQRKDNYSQLMQY